MESGRECAAKRKSGFHTYLVRKQNILLEKRRKEDPMAKKGLRYQLDRTSSVNNDWNRTILRLEKSWKELNAFLEKGAKKKGKS